MLTTYISYPGLSEELIIDKNYACKNFYEIVSSCGVFCRMPETLQKRFLLQMSRADLPVKGYIFITDEFNSHRLSKLIGDCLKNFVIVPYKNTSYINEYGLRVNQPKLVNSKEFENLVQKNPDYLVLVSTPYSCPDLTGLVKNKDTIANRSSLFYFENKEVYSRKFSNELGFVEEIKSGDYDKLAKIINRSPGSLFFLKPLGLYTGGSTIIPLNDNVLFTNKELILRIVNSRTHYLFRKLDALNIFSRNGEHFGTQFRLFLDYTNTPLAFIVKFPSVAGVEGKKTSIKRLNQQYNSSSGNATSVIFEYKDKFKPISLSLGREEAIIDTEKINSYISEYRLGKFSLSDQGHLDSIAQILKPKAIEIRKFFNDFFFEQDWASLYRKFVVEKSYFN